MARRPMTPARRKRRTIRMAIALPILLAVLVLVLGAREVRRLTVQQEETP